MVGDQNSVITIGTALLAGTQIDNYYNNASNCFYRLTNWTYYDYPPYLSKMQDGTRSILTKISDTTNITQVASNDLWICNNFLENFVTYQTNKLPTFGGFT